MFSESGDNVSDKITKTTDLWLLPLVSKGMYNGSFHPVSVMEILQETSWRSLETKAASPRETTGDARAPRSSRRLQHRCTPRLRHSTTRGSMLCARGSGDSHEMDLWHQIARGNGCVSYLPPVLVYQMIVNSTDKCFQCLCVSYLAVLCVS